MNWEKSYRELASREAERIKELSIANFIKRAWRKADGVMQWVELNWWDYDLPNGYENHLAALKATFAGGGYVLGAFDGEKLIGYCSLNREIFGGSHKYVLLDQVFLSTAYQRKGIGRKLISMCAEKAKSWGAEKLFVCAGSAEDTLAFYHALGFAEAIEKNQALQEKDENDIQLELAIMDFTGVIIEESLRDASILNDIKIMDTKVEEVTERHETPWLKKWMLHTVFIPVGEAESIAKKLSGAFDVNHTGNWYADFKNEQFHYVIFPDKVFKLDKKIKSQWDSMQTYALSIGLPKHQLLTYESVDEP